MSRPITDAHVAGFWRNTFVSSKTTDYQMAGMVYEEARAHAESCANDLESTFIESMEARGYELSKEPQ